MTLWRKGGILLRCSLLRWSLNSSTSCIYLFSFVDYRKPKCTEYLSRTVIVIYETVPDPGVPTFHPWLCHLASSQVQ